MVLRRERRYGFVTPRGAEDQSKQVHSPKDLVLPGVMSTFSPEPISVNCLFPQAKSCYMEILLFF